MENGVAISGNFSNYIISYYYQNKKTLNDQEQGLKVNLLDWQPYESNRKIRWYSYLNFNFNIIEPAHSRALLQWKPAGENTLKILCVTVKVMWKTNNYWLHLDEYQSRVIVFLKTCH